MSDESTTVECLTPDPRSECLNCGKPGTAHIDNKCPFEASSFEPSSNYVEFKATPIILDQSGVTLDTVWGFTKVYK
jgi:hypothetical protein